MTTPLDGARPLVAVVLAFPVPGADPMDKVAGLPLALRTVLTLQKEGCARVLLIIPDDRSDIGARVTGDSRVSVPVDVLPASSASLGLSSVGPRIDAPFLLAMHEALVSPAIYRALKGNSLLSAAAVIAVKEGKRVGPLLASPELPALLDGEDIDAALARLLAERHARAFEVGNLWEARATTKEGRRVAIYELFEACRKPVDGVVARNINRHISIFLSKRLVGTPITPNMMSALTFLLAIAATYFAALGGYWNTLLAAFLFQWNSILDGVDGELARVRFQHSKLGQWLDTVSDDVSNIIFYAGLGVGAASLPGGRILGASALVAIVASLLTMAQHYTELVRVGSGDLYAIEWDFDKKPPKGFAGKLLIFWRNVVKKDFAILFFLALAAVGVLPYGLPIIAGAAVGALIAATLRTLKKRGATAGGAG